MTDVYPPIVDPEAEEPSPAEGSGATEGALPPASAPYREPAPPAIVVAEAPAVYPRPSSVRGKAVVGAAFWAFGVLLWAFVSMGVLVTTTRPGGGGPLVEEGIGVAFVVVSTLAALVLSVRVSEAAAPARLVGLVLRGVLAALLAVPGWVVVVLVFASIGRSASKNMDTPITLFLLVLAGGAFFLGRYLLGARGGERGSQQRLVSRALWTVATLVTLSALVLTFAADH